MAGPGVPASSVRGDPQAPPCRTGRNPVPFAPPPAAHPHQGPTTINIAARVPVAILERSARGSPAIPTAADNRSNAQSTGTTMTALRISPPSADASVGTQPEEPPAEAGFIGELARRPLPVPPLPGTGHLHSGLEKEGPPGLVHARKPGGTRVLASRRTSADTLLVPTESPLRAEHTAPSQANRTPGRISRP